MQDRPEARAIVITIFKKYIKINISFMKKFTRNNK